MNYAGLDVTDIFSAALREDHGNNHESMTGPAFGHEVCKALDAGKNHIRISRAWHFSQKHRDDEFQGFMDSFLNNSKSLPDFLNSVQVFKNKTNSKPSTVSDLSDVDALDFRPMIGYKGMWKNFRSDCLNIIRTWDHGTVFKNKK
tara:strand:- start:4629 stop:5063 length:435 start_codon:yes stop_codon:yes gene_type:complete